MQIDTTRFQTVDIRADDILLFPAGVFAFEKMRHWVLLSDADNASVGWLQSVSNASVALPVVSPRRFVPDYQVRVNRSQLALLELTAPDEAFVLTVVSRNEGRLTVNLKAPLIVNLDQRLGRQVVTNDEQPLQLDLAAAPQSYRRSA